MALRAPVVAGANGKSFDVELAMPEELASSSSAAAAKAGLQGPSEPPTLHDEQEAIKSSRHSGSIMPTLLQQSVAEFFGTAVMLAFGTGVVAQHELLAAPGASGGAYQLLQIHIGWGLAVTLGVLVSHRISGALLNPALMLGLWAAGKFPGHKLGAFALAQFLGGFAGAAVTGAYYWDFLRASGTSPASGTSGIFVTSKMSSMSMAGAVVDETLATALLIFVVLAVADDKHSAKCTTWHVAGFVGALVTAIGLSFGAQTGYALNPARDLGPRAFCAVAGWGATVFVDNYWLVPVFAPVLGALLGGQVYRLTLARY